MSRKFPPNNFDSIFFFFFSSKDLIKIPSVYCVRCILSLFEPRGVTPACTFCILHFFPDTEQARCHEDYPTPWTSPSTCGWFPDVPELGHFQSWLWLVVSEGTLCNPLRDKGVAHAEGGLSRRHALGTRHHCHIRGNPEGQGRWGHLAYSCPSPARHLPPLLQPGVLSLSPRGQYLLNTPIDFSPTPALVPDKF